MAGIDIISDSTGKEIVAAIQSTDVAQARILEINTAAESKKNEVLESIPEDYTNLNNDVAELKGDLDNLADSIITVYFDKNITSIAEYQTTYKFQKFISKGTKIYVHAKNMLSNGTYHQFSLFNHAGAELNSYIITNDDSHIEFSFEEDVYGISLWADGVISQNASIKIYTSDDIMRNSDNKLFKIYFEQSIHSVSEYQKKYDFNNPILSGTKVRVYAKDLFVDGGVHQFSLYDSNKTDLFDYIITSNEDYSEFLLDKDVYGISIWGDGLPSTTGKIVIYSYNEILSGIQTSITDYLTRSIPFISSTYGNKYRVIIPSGETEKVIYTKSGRGMIYYMQFIGSNIESQREIMFKQSIEVWTDGNLYFKGKLYELAGMDTDHHNVYDYAEAIFSNPLFAKISDVNPHIELKYKIPFYENVTVKLIQAEEYKDTPTIQFVTIKVSDNINIEYNGVVIPDGAYLHSDKVLVENLQPGMMIDLLNSTKNGMIVSHSIFCYTTNINFVEGCIRAFLNGNTSEYLLISTGLEDYFAMPYGFYMGKRQFDSVGVTDVALRPPTSDGKYIVSAYHNFIDEPFCFRSGGFRLTGRNCDQNTGYMDINSTENLADWGGGTAPMDYGSQITYYEWD